MYGRSLSTLLSTKPVAPGAVCVTTSNLDGPWPSIALAQTPKPGGTLISARTTEATGLDPQLVPAFSRSRRSPMMYSQLVRFDPDMNPIPELAESWEVSKDALTWTFKLRQGVKFHDGQEMTSADVKFTFDRLFEKSPGKSDFIAVDKVEPAGRHAVKFITKEPFAGLLAALGGFWGFIISEAGIKKHGDLNKAALGTGPFMLQDWKVEQQMVLKRHPGYFKKGLPHVDEVNLRIIPDEANIVAALRTGQIHHAFIEDNKNYNLLRDEKTLTGYRSSRLGYDFLNINASRGPLKDVRVRGRPADRERGEGGATGLEKISTCHVSRHRGTSWGSFTVLGLVRCPVPHWTLGSRMSRRPSPIRLNASTLSMIAMPGNTEIHGAVSR